MLSYAQPAGQVCCRSRYMVMAVWVLLLRLICVLRVALLLHLLLAGLDELPTQAAVGRRPAAVPRRLPVLSPATGPRLLVRHQPLRELRWVLLAAAAGAAFGSAAGHAQLDFEAAAARCAVRAPAAAVVLQVVA